jgi:predicted AlkP superfamily pyrophosphatase or phosphodiesterase
MKLKYILLFLLVNQICFGQTKLPISPKPKLVIGLVIDQMRYDYLFKYEKNYTQGGFKRLMREGFTCHNANLNYIPSVTGCGHASIYTGSVPAINGIASNDWYDKSTHKMMYCVQDDNANTVGSIGKSGKMSPKNLWTSTIGDELKLSNNMRSKVIGISLKDRGSILPAGHAADAAFWMDDSLGNFVTSTYYMQNLPTWATQFNEANYAKKYLMGNWELCLSKEKYYQSSNDSNGYEGFYKTEKTNTLPHLTSLFSKNADVKRTPFGNNISLDFSKAAIINYNLGKGVAADFLAISLSSTDYVGHQFGINAIETEDMYYRLDKSLEDFLLFLDKQIGAGNYTLFLTADHGAAHNPQYLLDNKIAAGYFNNGEIRKKINEKSLVKFGKKVIADMGDNEIWLNDSIDYNDALAFVKNELSTQTEIQYLIENKNLAAATIPAKIKLLATNGYNNSRSGDLLYLLKPGFIESYNGAKTGTTHGTWNPYDSHIPLVWFGNGIKKGSNYNLVNVTDIAATLAALLKIQAPNGCIGEVLTEVIKQ